MRTLDKVRSLTGSKNPPHSEILAGGCRQRQLYRASNAFDPSKGS
jgi:hypothetical protein